MQIFQCYWGCRGGTSQEPTERSEPAAAHFFPTHDDTDMLLLVFWDTGQWQILTNSSCIKRNFLEVQKFTWFHQFLIREEESLKYVFLEETEAFGLSKPCRTLSWKAEAVFEGSPCVGWRQLLR